MPKRRGEFPQVVAPCPKCKAEVNVGRSKVTGSLIINCVTCKTHFPDAANEKRLLDANVISGWNVYAQLQAQLELGLPLDQTDFAGAMERVKDFVIPQKRQP